ncbi:MAG: hypothetical protein LBE36_13310 [Flavobacteriaceae bacterium]|jgi:very-short-patch-repair endonuclease|nr:hypothetical protein [Flavobacteriaceae bacterium]
MDLLRGYLQYLKDVSRKIISRAGFDNVLPSRGKNDYNYYYSLDTYHNLKTLFKTDGYEIPISDNALKTYIDKVNNYIKDKNHVSLYFGLGLVHGKHKPQSGSEKKMIAPLITVVCNIDKNEQGKIFIDVDEESYQLNYDLLSRFMNLEFDEEYEDNKNLTQEDKDRLNKIDEIEKQIHISGNKREIPDVQNIYNQLKEIIPNFDFSQREQTEIFANENDDKFNYDERNNFNGLRFLPHIFCFVRQLPDALSTYESINQILKISQNNETETNRLLEIIITNAVGNKNIDLPLSDEIAEFEIKKAIESIPFSLSKKQKEAILKTWMNPITYIEGAPGTGKSYTIQAIIHSALLLNKKVLFVSHKIPAINVVRNGINKSLGENALFFPTEKNTARNYLSELLNYSNFFSYKQYDEIEGLKNEIESLNFEIQNLSKQISDDLNVANKYLELNKNFVDRREYFESKRNHKDHGLGLSLQNYKFNANPLNRGKFDYLYKRLNLNKANRLNEILKIKTQKYFIDIFNANKDLSQSTTQYLKDIFELNYYYSEAFTVREKIVSQRLDYNRKRLYSKEIVLLNKQKELFKKNFFYNVRDKIKNQRDNIQNYRASLFWNLPKKKLDNWNDISFESLINAIPLWCSELSTLGKILPMKKELFDLVIIDEASQVNIAEITPAFYRGKRFCIVGDEKQLHLNATGVGFSLPKSLDNLFWSKNQELSKEVDISVAKNSNLLVSESSILQFVNSDKRIQYIPTVALDEHFRSLPMLANFNNNIFYKNNWKIMTETGKNRDINCFRAMPVMGKRDDKLKFVQAEIDELIKQLKTIINQDLTKHPDLKQFDFSERKPTIGILSFLRNQVTKIREVIEDEISEQDIEDYEIMIGTAEEFQGNEKDIMFITVGLDNTKQNWGKGYFENENRFNVATSRAKLFTYFIYSGVPKTAKMIRKYLNHFGIKTISDENLVDTEDIKDDIIVPDVWTYDYNKFESEFEEKVAEKLEQYTKDKPKIKLFNQVNACGQKRLDFVLYNEENKTTCAVEVDGSSHFISDNSETYTEKHIERIDILKRAGWKVINIKYYNWYWGGWLCNDENKEPFKSELDNLYKELNEALGVID